MKNKIIQYLSDDSAVSGSVEQIIFITGGIVIGGAVVWYIYHQIKNQTEKSRCDSNDSPWCVE